MTCVIYNSPIDPLTLVSDGSALTALLFDRDERAPAQVDKPDAVLKETMKQLDQYFAGKRTAFDLPLNPSGTEFQKRVWMALRGIPYGKAVAYRDIAAEIGSPKAVRAVGGANGCNPIAIIVPCHRVIGADGSLTGFGGGIERKRFLLALERGEQALVA
jgi:methylated-DNA-[protein]-cysteine S-methyltransferase